MFVTLRLFLQEHVNPLEHVDCKVVTDKSEVSAIQ